MGERSHARCSAADMGARSGSSLASSINWTLDMAAALQASLACHTPCHPCSAAPLPAAPAAAGARSPLRPPARPAAGCPAGEGGRARRAMVGHLWACGNGLLQQGVLRARSTCIGQGVEHSSRCAERASIATHSCEKTKQPTSNAPHPQVLLPVLVLPHVVLEHPGERLRKGDTGEGRQGSGGVQRLTGVVGAAGQMAGASSGKGDSTPQAAAAWCGIDSSSDVSSSSCQRQPAPAASGLVRPAGLPAAAAAGPGS